MRGCAADILSLLADIGMEQENFESAMQDHKRALELLSTILQVCPPLCTCLPNNNDCNSHDNVLIRINIIIAMVILVNMTTITVTTMIMMMISNK